MGKDNEFFKYKAGRMYLFNLRNHKHNNIYIYRYINVLINFSTNLLKLIKLNYLNNL